MLPPRQPQRYLRRQSRSCSILDLLASGEVCRVVTHIGYILEIPTVNLWHQHSQHRPTFGGRQHSMKDDLCWNTNFDGWLHLMKEDLFEDNLKGRTTYGEIFRLRSAINRHCRHFSFLAARSNSQKLFSKLHISQEAVVLTESFQSIGYLNKKSFWINVLKMFSVNRMKSP